MKTTTLMEEVEKIINPLNDKEDRFNRFIELLSEILMESTESNTP